MTFLDAPHVLLQVANQDIVRWGAVKQFNIAQGVGKFQVAFDP